MDLIQKHLEKGQVQNLIRIAKKREIILEKDIILIPINKTNSHWLFLEINKGKEDLIIYDSIKQSINQYEYYFNIIMALLEELEKEKGQRIQWRRKIDKDFPNQNNSYDCGVFMLKGIHFRSQDQPVTFDQQDMAYFRKLIAVEIMQGTIKNYNY